MLKRYQVLLPDWLEEYTMHLADRYNLSFSEIIRIQICFSTLSSVSSFYPEYKPSTTIQEISKLAKEIIESNLGREELNKLISKLYFEGKPPNTDSRKKKSKKRNNSFFFFQILSFLIHQKEVHTHLKNQGSHQIMFKL